MEAETRHNDGFKNAIMSLHEEIQVTRNDGTVETFIGPRCHKVPDKSDREEKTMFSICAYPRNEIEGPGEEPLYRILIPLDQIKQVRLCPIAKS